MVCMECAEYRWQTVVQNGTLFLSRTTNNNPQSPKSAYLDMQTKAQHHQSGIPLEFRHAPLYAKCAIFAGTGCGIVFVEDNIRNGSFIPNSVLGLHIPVQHCVKTQPMYLYTYVGPGVWTTGSKAWLKRTRQKRYCQ